MIITIDGPVATGKSTVAKKLASSIGYIYFDTGAMYRACTFGLLDAGIDLNDVGAITAFLDTFDFRIKVMRGERRYFLGLLDVTDAIRSERVTANVPKVSAMPIVRSKITSLLRELAKGVNAVFEGRDMGTVVFPDAQVKVFLSVRPEVAAKRRYEELLAKYPEEAKATSVEKMLEDIKRRNEYDSTREVAPLKQPPDAGVIDTSDLTVDEVVNKILEYKDTLKLKVKI
jgi:cytidylate kinase